MKNRVFFDVRECRGFTETVARPSHGLRMVSVMKIRRFLLRCLRYSTSLSIRRLARSPGTTRCRDRALLHVARPSHGQTKSLTSKIVGFPMLGIQVLLVLLPLLVLLVPLAQLKKLKYLAKSSSSRDNHLLIYHTE